MDKLPLITSTANPLIKLARSLRNKKERAQTGQFLVEGILHVGEAAAANWKIDAVLYAPDLLASDFAKNLILELERKGVRCQPVSAQVFASVADKENPQGIMAIVQQRAYALGELDPAAVRFGAACVSPQDPGNVGTILRTLDAVGADVLFLLEGGVDPYHPSAVRASMGTLFWKPVVQTSFSAFVDWARAHGHQLIGTSAHGSVDYRSVSLSDQPSVLVLGSEQKGLTSEQSAVCDVLVKLPMRGRATSLNLAVAAGVLLYALKG